MTLASHHPTAWATPTVPSNYPLQHDDIGSFPQYQETADFSQEFVPAGPSRRSTGYLSPEGADRTRTSRSTSFASNASSYSQSDASRSVSPSASEMLRWGRKNENGSWSCAYPGCNSRSTFNRGCDLRKHYKRHMKSLFCRHEGCPQATEGGFSSKKDRARHEARHNPSVPCEWEDCPRLFSRVDNMVSLQLLIYRPLTNRTSAEGSCPTGTQAQSRGVTAILRLGPLVYLAGCGHAQRPRRARIRYPQS